MRIDDTQKTKAQWTQENTSDIMYGPMAYPNSCDYKDNYMRDKQVMFDGT